MKEGDEISLHVEAFASEGKCVTHIDGFAVFVQGVVPGDEVKARMKKVKSQYAEAVPIEVTRRSPLRTDPRCKYFGVCGGCKWQQVDYNTQLESKRQQVVDALQRIGGFDRIHVNETLGSEEIYFYRNKMEFSFGDQWFKNDQFAAWKAQGESTRPFALGLHLPERFDKVLDIDECWLQSPHSNLIINAVRRFALDQHLSIYSIRTHEGYLRNLVIREGRRTGETMVNLVTGEDRPEVMNQLKDRLLSECPGITTIVNNITTRKSQLATGEYERVYHGSGFITERLGNKVFRISANSFFQTNSMQAERLYEVAKRMAKLERTDVVFDLYSGTGTIALYLADQVAGVVGIELIESAALDARRNAELNGLTNCWFEIGDMKDKLTNDREWIERHGLPTVLIIDPPRSGMHKKAVGAMLGLRPRRMVYVSCNPATQARDLKLLCEDGKYEIEEVQPVDMFPHTYHIENVVALKRTL